MPETCPPAWRTSVGPGAPSVLVASAVVGSRRVNPSDGSAASATAPSDAAAVGLRVVADFDEAGIALQERGTGLLAQPASSASDDARTPPQRLNRHMIWAILIAVGVPLWLCVAGILTFVLRNRALRTRAGNIPCRLRTAPDKRWVRGHGVWVHDVFAFRGSPAAWSEQLLWAADIESRPSSADEDKKLHGIGSRPVIATIVGRNGDGTVEVAARREDGDLLLRRAPAPEAARAG
jgi:hypothetical protein